MSMKRIVGATLAGFVLLAAGRYLIHSVWLMSEYMRTPTVWRTQPEMVRHLWALYAANLLFAHAATHIYVRGVEPKPWLGQGLRFGILLACATAAPQSLVEYFTYPVSHTLTIQWIIGEGALAVLLGIVIAAICRPKTTTP